MKYFFAIYLTFLLGGTTVFSQNKVITHKVEKGETVLQIAQKYHVTPYDIYQLNPDAQSGLKPNTVLLIAKQSDSKKEIATVVQKTNSGARSHTVTAKETLYGIGKTYDISDDDLKKANPFLEKDGLKIGQTLVIPSKTGLKTASSSVVSQSSVFHEVIAKETKYSIAKQYGITVEELEKKNPEVVANLPIGYKLIIKGTAPRVVAGTVPVLNGKEKAEAVVNTTLPEFTTYEVQPKETLYSLSKSFGLTQEELIALNPLIKEGVEIGMVLKVPTKTATAQEVKKEYTALTPKVNFDNRKRLIMLLPFNISKIENDSINTTVERLKKDKFLNMTLDFYAGALIAIDSAKTMGLPIDVEIYDSEETKNSSAITGLVSNYRLQTANAVIGPFYQSNAEATAQLLSMNNVPVISPLSKDVGRPYGNLFQTIPAPEVVKNTMFEYMRGKNGNIMAVVDKKKESVLQYLKQYQPHVPLVALNSGSSISAESLKGMLVKDRMNFVVMETANTMMVKSTIAAMLSVMSTHQVQLVILEPNETLDTDEIKFTNLIKLKLMYPSVTRDSALPEGIIFSNKFKKVNTIFPSDYATRGFDVTFDTMMRMVQEVKFEETVNAVATEQVESKFEYYKKSDGGYTNKGVFIMYYDEDLTIKEAK
ncbi:LysM peptidoglycan-binding domain-containing protein [Flavobacterium sp. F-380]|uniref:LysM peptidoglycan-binding domain-containing protein n=1 Tax=Flavobacterium kayseriense TaxID=2764714 RepID=A0ABR7J6P3_9FLAO|nr:LysM peptidoglycan-binding domain-containing protein [Flavobacterium kayseriense]MBC5841127.1 LysM peptidoglycan-binding domain-containing protein [Flavobacterium kayseriense]MBC5847655.1 LysM peptidoglycan-binding domain-containing protein [Flavobacterium kayseriense]